MEKVISSLVQSFEKGKMTRRELVQTLAVLTLSGGTTAAQGLRVRNVDHASVLVSDMARSVEFYQRVFGFSIVSEDEENEIVRLGFDGQILLSLRHEATPGVIDHFAFGVEGFDAESATRMLEARGVTPEPVNIDYGFHFKDPDGAIVQLSRARP
mgnify:FL=1